MSLTSFLDRPDVKAAFRARFEKPDQPRLGEPRIKPTGKRFGVIGGAIEVIIGALIGREQPGVIARPWFCEQALDDKMLLEDDPDKWDLAKGFEKQIRQARATVSKYIRGEEVSWLQLARAALNAAQVDAHLRRPSIDLLDDPPGLCYYKPEVAELEQLANLWQMKATWHSNRKTVVLCPTFGEGSLIVGGGMGDMLLDDTLMDIKCVSETKFRREYFNQLVGYCILAEIGGVDGVPPGHRIRNIAVYFARHGETRTISLDDVMYPSPMSATVAWFQELVVQHRRPQDE